MNKIFAKSTDPTIASGRHSQNDLKKYGYIGLEFFVKDSQIGLDISGFSTYHTFYFKPKTQEQVRSNVSFVECIINKCQNPEQLKKSLGITNY